MRIIGQIVLWSLASLGGFILLLTIIGSFAVSHHHGQSLPKKIMLSLDANADIREMPSNATLLAGFHAQHGYFMRDLVQSLDRAAQDPRVQGIVLRIETPSMGMAQIQELRDSIANFRNSGKRTVVYSTTIGGEKNGTLAYYLASACKEIWLQPSGEVDLTGFMLQSPFVKEMFNLLGIKAEFGARHEFKSAIETFTHDRFSSEARQPLELLIKNWTRQSNEGIAANRNLSIEEISSLTNRAPLLADEAIKAKLVDRLGYWDELEKSWQEQGVELVDINRYAREAATSSPSVDVALIYGVGEIVSGGQDFMSGNNVMTSSQVTQAFRDAVKDQHIKAILFRINSPGGSYIASDSIWREVGNARNAGKPVVVSMGNVAASGGYFVAMPADQIIAEPGTITGSIGVFSGKFVMTDFWKKIGISWDKIGYGQNAGMWSVNDNFSPSQWQRLNNMLDHVYADFTGKAMAGRHLNSDEIDRLARGRIWSGEEAKRVGLVDALGGYEQAFVAIRRLTRQPAQMPVHLIAFPQPKPPLQTLLELMANEQLPSDVAALNKFARLVAPLTEALSAKDGNLRIVAPVTE